MNWTISVEKWRELCVVEGRPAAEKKGGKGAVKTQKLQGLDVAVDCPRETKSEVTCGSTGVQVCEIREDRKIEV